MNTNQGNQISKGGKAPRLAKELEALKKGGKVKKVPKKK
jgi:hypothetical protein